MDIPEQLVQLIQYTLPRESADIFVDEIPPQGDDSVRELVAAGLAGDDVNDSVLEHARDWLVEREQLLESRDKLLLLAEDVASEIGGMIPPWFDLKEFRLVMEWPYAEDLGLWMERLRQAVMDAEARIGASEEE